MKCKEFQITVTKDSDGNYWYTAYTRRVYLFFNSKWKVLTPMNQSTYDRARVLVASELEGYWARFKTKK